MRLHLVGGFLGAGKTTLVSALARHLRARGERVAIVTNDQGRALVDTALLGREADRVAEIAGGCFCCRYDALEDALAAAADAGATVSVAEAVGSCTDLVATVVAPMAERRVRAIDPAPLAIAVDPWRVLEIAAGGAPPDVAYLFRKQIEEADVVLLTRSDLGPPDVTGFIRELRPDAAIVAVSGTTGEGIDAWLAARPRTPASPLDIDYARYGAAEALLGWANGTVSLRSETPFDPVGVVERFLLALREHPVAHVKVASVDPPGIHGALVRRGGDPVLRAGGAPRAVRSASWIVNARVAVPPDVLERVVRDAFASEARPAADEWESFECFSPSPPRPQHRASRRPDACAEPGTHGSDCCTRGGDETEAPTAEVEVGPALGPVADGGSCCAAFYARPDVRFLLGDSWHPGGEELTRRLAEHLDVSAGDLVLDVACGKGTSLRTVVARCAVRGLGIDASPPSTDDPAVEYRRGDAHALPVEDSAVDGVLCECALSTFADPARALREMARVLRPGARALISDMVVEGEVPEPLRPWVSVGTCLAGARSMAAYGSLIEASGLRVVAGFDATSALSELVARIKRNLVGLALAARTGNLGADVRVDVRVDVRAARDALRAAEDAVSKGVLRYGAFVAERRG